MMKKFLILAMGSILGVFGSLTFYIGYLIESSDGTYLSQIISYYRGNDYSGFVHDYDTLITMFPKHASLYIVRADAKVLLRAYSGAIQDYDKAITLGHYQPPVYIMRGIQKMRLGNFQDAVEDFNRVIDFSGDVKGYVPYNFAYFMRGFVEYYLGNYAAAIRDYDKAIEIYSWEAVVYSNRGLVKYKLKDFTGALQDFNKTIDLSYGELIFFPVWYDYAKEITFEKTYEFCIDLKNILELGYTAAGDLIIKYCK